jgi:hypothetical protein
MFIDMKCSVPVARKREKKTLFCPEEMSTGATAWTGTPLFQRAPGVEFSHKQAIL